MLWAFNSCWKGDLGRVKKQLPTTALNTGRFKWAVSKQLLMGCDIINLDHRKLNYNCGKEHKNCIIFYVVSQNIVASSVDILKQTKSWFQEFKAQQDNRKSNFDNTRGITPKHVTSGGADLGG